MKEHTEHTVEGLIELVEEYGRDMSNEAGCASAFDRVGSRQYREYAQESLAAIREYAASLSQPPAAGEAIEPDLLRDVARYRWLRSRAGLSVFTGERVRFRPFDSPHEIEVGQIGATDLDDAIDAALQSTKEQS